MRLSGAEYEQFALEHPDEKWELHCGVLRKKPSMTWDHNLTARALGRILWTQLDPREYDIVLDQGRVRRASESYYIPDLYVVPIGMRRQLYRQGALEVYPYPLPLVVEVWSPSTGSYDVESKLPEYQRRGDWEVWRIHPYERTLIAWRRQPDGSYSEELFTEGVIRPVALPGVTIEIASLFDWE